MKSTFYPVHIALRDFVNHILVVETWLDDNRPQRHIPFPPTPQNNINFYPADAMHTRKHGEAFAKAADVIIVGPQTKRVDLVMGKHHVMLSVCFNPGGMFSLLKIPMYELKDQPFSAADIIGKEIEDINYQLKEMSNAWDMKALVESYLLNKLRHVVVKPFDKALKSMLYNNVFNNIDEVASASCISNRQFERRCLDALGYSPKMYTRIIRFSKAYRIKVNHPGLTWGQIAYMCKYYDQMHLVKDFKEFTGGNPTSIGREITLSPIQVQQNIGL